MTQASKLLQRLLEGEFTHGPPIAKTGWRVGTADSVSWYLCDDCLNRRVINRHLRTNRGYVSVAEVMPVDDDSHQCQFCRANLSPQTAMPAPAPAQQAPAEPAPAEEPMPNESLLDAVHHYKCNNSGCEKYRLVIRKKGPNSPAMSLGQKCATCKKPLVWQNAKADADPMAKPEVKKGRLMQ